MKKLFFIVIFSTQFLFAVNNEEFLNNLKSKIKEIDKNESYEYDVSYSYKSLNNIIKTSNVKIVEIVNPKKIAQKGIYILDKDRPQVLFSYFDDYRMYCSDNSDHFDLIIKDAQEEVKNRKKDKYTIDSVYNLDEDKLTDYKVKMFYNLINYKYIVNLFESFGKYLELNENKNQLIVKLNKDEFVFNKSNYFPVSIKTFCAGHEINIEFKELKFNVQSSNEYYEKMEQLFKL